MRYFFAFIVCVLLPSFALAQIEKPMALTPGDVWVVVNSNKIASVALGEFYCQQRQVPMNQLIRLDLPETEEMTRSDYESKLLTPLREKLAAVQNKDIVLLTTFGVPIRVGAADLKPTDEAKLEMVKRELKKLHDDLHELGESIRKLNEAGDTARAKLYQPDVTRTNQAIANLKQQEARFSLKESYAAVDSELSLMWQPDYPLAQWQFNFRYFTLPDSMRSRQPKIVMTCRIDGPTATVAKRIVEDAMKAEAAGGPLGMSYVDARGISWDKNQDPTASTYGGFDESLRELAVLTREAGIRTVLNNVEEVFPLASCPQAALYYGWYALENYKPALELVTGSIAIHAASFEAVSLRNKDKARWVPNLLADGAAVTVGPVAEPYLIAFPKPAVFFGFLLAGHTVVESYWLSNPMTSWQMMLIGDPLYRPYGNKPKIASKQVKQSPAGSQFPVRAGR